MGSKHSFRCRRRGFTLVEMLVVIGIIALLIAMLLPSLTKARSQAQKVQCMSNMRQVGLNMMNYAEQWNGYLFPAGMGWKQDAAGNILTPAAPNGIGYWTWTYVEFSDVWNPPVMRCPQDEQPLAEHSYIVNDWLTNPYDGSPTSNGGAHLKYGSTIPNGRSPSDVVLMGEKVTQKGDFYMEPAEFDGLVDPYKHGLSLGSNYLMLDMHVDILLPAQVADARDPWDIVGAPTSSPGPQ